MTYYIIDGQTIINAVETSSKERAEECARGMIHGERLRVSASPPKVMLEAYRYWNERPPKVKLEAYHYWDEQP